MSFLKELKAGVDNKIVVRFPGTETEVELHVLSNQDTLDASLAADRLYKDQEIRVGFENIKDYESERTTQLLFRAMRVPGTGKTIADNITEFRSLLTVAERAALVDEYNALDERCNPSPETLPAEKFDALVEDLKKKPQETIGSISSMSTLRRLALFSASQAWPSPKDSGSTSS